MLEVGKCSSYLLWIKTTIYHHHHLIILSHEFCGSGIWSGWSVDSLSLFHDTGILAGMAQKSGAETTVGWFSISWASL